LGVKQARQPLSLAPDVGEGIRIAFHPRWRLGSMYDSLFDHDIIVRIVRIEIDSAPIRT
jgi:hypothetical protein